MKYFTQSMTQEDAKKLFRKLAVELHPDKGGSHNDFIVMKAQYEAYLRGTGNHTTKEAKDLSEALASYVQANEFIKNFDGVLVELTGTWVWLSGNTQPYKEQIKEQGFKWSRNKGKWFKAPYELKGKRKRGTNFAKIKDTYGYDSMKISGIKKIA